MDSIKFKPLGSVISINGSEKRFMIIARALSIRTRDGKTAFFDYGAVMYPEGLIGKNIIYFQDKDIREVVFEGFDDPENAQLMERVAERLKRVNVQHLIQRAVQHLTLQQMVVLQMLIIQKHLIQRAVLHLKQYQSLILLIYRM